MTVTTTEGAKSREAGEGLLIIGANEVEAVLASVALARGLEGAVTRLFLDSAGLGSLGELPAFRGGRRPSCLLGFPAPALAARAKEATGALVASRDLLWVSDHPLDGEVGLEGASGVRVGEAAGSLFASAAPALGCPEGAMAPLLSAIAEPLPRELPGAARASPALAWRYAIEACRQAPMTLGARTKALLELGPPDPELVAEGRALILGWRELAAGSRLHTFPTPHGSAVILLGPQSALGLYAEVAAEARRDRGCALSLLSFDSGEPAVVEYESPPADLAARIELVRGALPEHGVYRYGRRGFAVKGRGTGQLEVLELLISLLSRELAQA